MSRAPWALLLVQGVLMGQWRATAVTVERKTRQGRSVTLLCPPDTRGGHWTWQPRFPRCATVRGQPLPGSWGGPTGLGHLAQFQGRLSLVNGSLELRNAVMSDSGVFTCSGRPGGDSSIDLRVEGGCFNNIAITLTEEQLLFCKVCKMADAFDELSAIVWTVNGEAPRKEALRGKLGARVAPDLSRDVDWGKWMCTSRGNPAWHAEYCIEPADVDYSPAADMEAENDAEQETTWKPLFRALVAAGSMLVLILAAILFACCLGWTSSDREKEKTSEEGLENTAGASSSEVMLPALKEHLPRQRSQPPPETRSAPKKNSDDLLYVQLDHFPTKPDAQRPPPGDRVTIYATIV
ncbi:uncharacterized protein [Ambystoma mexicanum]|uniref:uncharacterized protein n=1 Tax=Ambystoma mexicanum TaxID=8296 RepID=UPI0037E7A9E9